VLAEHFLRRHAQRHQKSTTGFDAGALQVLLHHPWPGNVRELSHVIERAVLLSHGNQISPADLALSAPGGTSVRLEDLTLEEVERVLIEKALSRYEHNISQAASALGLSRTALYRRLEKYGLGSASSKEPGA
jgi:DNA-binding NtrC family response regulator